MVFNMIFSDKNLTIKEIFPCIHHADEGTFQYLPTWIWSSKYAFEFRTFKIFRDKRKHGYESMLWKKKTWNRIHKARGSMFNTKNTESNRRHWGIVETSLSRKLYRLDFALLIDLRLGGNWYVKWQENTKKWPLGNLDVEINGPCSCMMDVFDSSHLQWVVLGAISISGYSSSLKVTLILPPTIVSLYDILTLWIEWYEHDFGMSVERIHYSWADTPIYTSLLIGNK